MSDPTSSDVRDWTLRYEADTGYDSIPTIERVYCVGEDEGLYECVHPGCGWRTRDAERMWRHVHGLTRKHPRVVMVPDD